MCIVSSLATIADGLILENGHLNAGPYITLKLNQQQLLTVKTKRIVVLTAAQKKILMAKANVAPTVLTVYSKEAAKTGIDVCFEYNLALWVDERTIEVPMKYLVSDSKAIEKANEFDAID